MTVDRTYHREEDLPPLIAKARVALRSVQECQPWLRQQLEQEATKDMTRDQDIPNDKNPDNHALGHGSTPSSSTHTHHKRNLAASHEPVNT